MADFIKGKIYRHPLGKDLDMLILKVYYKNERYTKVKASLVFRTTGEVCVTESYTITNKEDWNELKALGTGYTSEISDT